MVSKDLRQKSTQDNVAVLKSLPKELQFLIGLVTGNDAKKKKDFVQKHQALFTAQEVTNDTSEFMMEVKDAALRAKLVLAFFVGILLFSFFYSGSLMLVLLIGLPLYFLLMHRNIYTPIFGRYKKVTSQIPKSNVMLPDDTHASLDTQLRSLTTLRDKGSISDEEYDRRRLEVLDKY